MNKECPRCHETDLSKFSKNRQRPDGFQVYCKPCARIYKIDWIVKHPEKYTRGRIETRWRSRGIDITKEEYDQRVKDQSNLCALCFKPFDELNNPAVDHDHRTGKVRAILHTRCNAAIGLLGDDPATVMLALEYLERHLPKASVGENQ